MKKKLIPLLVICCTTACVDDWTTQKSIFSRSSFPRAASAASGQQPAVVARRPQTSVQETTAQSENLQTQTQTTLEPPEAPKSVEEALPAETFEPIEEESLFGDELPEKRFESQPAKLEIPKKDLIPDFAPQASFTAFSQSLETGDRRTSYSAAIAAVELNQQEAFKNYEMVMPKVAEIIKLTSMRNLYVISHNANLRNEIKGFCRDNGYLFNGSSNALEALKELYYSSARDLILIDAGLSLTDSKGAQTVGEDEFPKIKQVEVNDRKVPRQALFARELFNRLNKDVRTRQIPIVILANLQSTNDEIDVQTAREIYKDSVVDVVAKPFDGLALKEICDDLFHKQNQSIEDAKLEAEKLVLRACQAIINLRNRDTLFNTSKLTEALIEAFQEPSEGKTVARVPHVRKAAIEAMKTLATPKAFRPLMEVAVNLNNKDFVRAAAIECLGVIAQKQSLINQDRQALIEMLSDRLLEDNKLIWENAAHALGHINLDAQERKELAIIHRLNRARKY